MQLHHMTLSAIGPFAGEHYIDFSALSASGLFLLEGPTGSGKSTIIDAIVYALYGKVASDVASDDRVRSAYANESTESFVDLVFETNSGIYRVVRTPEWYRAKKRGTGVTKEQAGVTLWRLTPDDLDRITQCYAEGGNHEAVSALGLGTHRSSRMDEAGGEIARAIGLDRAQFVQTVVLPQGEFANFLRSDPGDRSALLQKVFGTEIYERAQASLAEMRRTAVRTIAEGEGDRRDAIRAFVQGADNPELDPELLAGATDEDLTSALEQELERLEAIETDAIAREASAMAHEQAARESFESARVTTERFAKRAELRTRKSQLEQSSHEMTQAEAALSSARRAAVVMPVALGLERAAADHDKALRESIQAVASAQDYAQLPELNGDFPPSLEGNDFDRRSTEALFVKVLAEGRSDLVVQRDHAQMQVGALAGLLNTESGLAQREIEIAREQTRVEKFTRELASNAELLAERPAGLLALSAERDQARSLSERVPYEEGRVLQAKGLIDAFGALEVARRGEVAAKAAIEVEAAKALAASSTEATLRASWLSQMAGQLAQELEDGTPCAVCGSLEHPNPAQLDESAVSKAQVDAAQSARQAAEKVLAGAQAAHAAAQERVTSAEKAVEGHDLESAQAERSNAEAALALARKATGELKELVKAVLDHERETADLQERQSRLGKECSALSSKVAQLVEQLESDKEAVARVLSEQPVADQHRDIASLRDWYAQAAASLTRLIAAIDALGSARSALADRTSEVAEALLEQGFEDVEAARASHLPAEQLRNLDHSVSSYRAEVASVNDRLMDEALAQLPETIDFDLDALREELQRAEALNRAAAVKSSSAKSTLVKSRSHESTVNRVLSKLGAARREVEPIIRMADIAAGTSPDNTKRQTLAVYVLVKRFEDVVAAANSRLVVMSDGRYELERSEEKEDVRTRKVGLALKVIDHNTESSRDPRTLSGGETFYVSLCLALGLADVVTAEAGGVELGTLFVDEGFGSLDPDTLESVLSVLGSLRDGGRTVGVVSHVETLKQAIGDGISVRHRESGGSTLTVRA